MRSVPQEWKDALIVPIPKKRRLVVLWQLERRQCTRCILLKKLQTVAEDVLPGTQCGFRSGRGRIDMIYCARQLVENAWDHNTQIFMLLIDLRKAYDSIPCSLLWHVLEKYGIPPSLLNIICSLHNGIKAEVTVKGTFTPDFEVRSRLRQGCVIAPSLFNFTATLSSQSANCNGGGNVQILE